MDTFFNLHHAFESRALAFYRCVARHDGTADRSGGEASEEDIDDIGQSHRARIRRSFFPGCQRLRFSWKSFCDDVNCDYDDDDVEEEIGRP